MGYQEPRRTLGSEGEDLAARHLREKGYKIIMRNYRTAWGEIDIIARHGRTLCFVEVKTRTSSIYGSPFEAVSLAKQRKLYKMALTYIRDKKLSEEPARFDVISVLLPKGGAATVDVLQNAFEMPG